MCILKKSSCQSLQTAHGGVAIVQSCASKTIFYYWVDFTGPVFYKEGSQRNPVKKKGFICMFICPVTKAVYVTLVADLSSAAFIAALRRFTALYSVPDTIQSDNQVLQAKSTQEDIHQWSALKGVKWLSIPSRAPHFGAFGRLQLGLSNLLLREWWHTNTQSG